ncbi:MAG: hypothetical protein ACOX2G_11015 [Bacillota bacterium]|jgi:hypothetical protein
MAELFEQLQENYNLLQEVSDEKKYRLLFNKKLGRVIERLGAFSQCPECKQYMSELNEALVEIISQGKLERIAAKQLNAKIHAVIKHLERAHQLLPEGTYMVTFMSLGLSLGIVFGLLVLDNVGLGIPFGLGLGIAIGAALDADAKKKGKVL